MDLDRLKAVAATARKPQQEKRNASYSKFDIDRWLEEHPGVRTSKREKNKNGDRYIYVVCPNNPSHKDAVIIVRAEGQIQYDCRHNSCSDWDWKKFREHHEPDAYTKKSRRGKPEPVSIAQGIADEYNLVYDRGELHIYEQGAYRQGFAFRLRKILQGKMGNAYRESAALEVQKYLESALWCDKPVLDCRKDIINVANGVIELAGDGISFRPHSPLDLSSAQLPVKYDPEATCEKIEKFLDDVLPEASAELLAQYAGYCLIPSTQYEKSLMLTGSGSNGKSTFIRILSALIGDENTAAETLHDLCSNRFRLANLAGKLLNVSADLSATSVDDVSLFKSLASGDMITAERKNRDPFAFRNFARMVFSANEIPRSRDASLAYFRRWLIVPFENSFLNLQRDTTLAEKLTTPNELSGFLNLAIAGLTGLRRLGDFTENSATREALENYKLSCDNVNQFVGERIAVSAEKSISKALVYTTYTEWARECGYHPLSAIRFNQRLQQTVSVEETRLTPRAGPSVRVWKGIELVT